MKKIVISIIWVLLLVALHGLLGWYLGRTRALEALLSPWRSGLWPLGLAMAALMGLRVWLAAVLPGLLLGRWVCACLARREDS